MTRRNLTTYDEAARTLRPERVVYADDLGPSRVPPVEQIAWGGDHEGGGPIVEVRAPGDDVDEFIDRIEAVGRLVSRLVARGRIVRRLHDEFGTRAYLVEHPDLVAGEVFAVFTSKEHAGLRVYRTDARTTIAILASGSAFNFT